MQRDSHQDQFQSQLLNICSFTFVMNVWTCTRLCSFEMLRSKFTFTIFYENWPSKITVLLRGCQCFRWDHFWKHQREHASDGGMLETAGAQYPLLVSGDKKLILGFDISIINIVLLHKMCRPVIGSIFSFCSKWKVLSSDRYFS